MVPMVPKIYFQDHLTIPSLKNSDHSRQNAVFVFKLLLLPAAPNPKIANWRTQNFALALLDSAGWVGIFAIALKRSCSNIHTGKRHVVNFHHLTQRALVVAASTPDPEERRWAKDNLEGVTIYGDVDEMLNRGDLDATVVASATSVHAEQALAAIAKGYHMMCEKPLSIDFKIVSCTSVLQGSVLMTLLIILRAGRECARSIQDFSAKFPGSEGHVRILATFRCFVSRSTRPHIERQSWIIGSVPFAT